MVNKHSLQLISSYHASFLVGITWNMPVMQWISKPSILYAVVDFVSNYRGSDMRCRIPFWFLDCLSDVFLVTVTYKCPYKTKFLDLSLQGSVDSQSVDFPLYYESNISLTIFFRNTSNQILVSKTEFWHWDFGAFPYVNYSPIWFVFFENQVITVCLVFKN